jgi:hypothetical protein
MIYNQFGVAVAYRTSGAIEWKEKWGEWPGPDWNNWEFNTQGFQEWYDPNRRQTFVRYAGWYRRGGYPPARAAEYGTGGGGETIPQEPLGPGGESPIPLEPGEYSGGGENPLIPQTPLGPGGESPSGNGSWGTGGEVGGGALGTGAGGTVMATDNRRTFQLVYNAYRQDIGYQDAATMMQTLELWARLHG